MGRHELQPSGSSSSQQPKLGAGIDQKAGKDRANENASGSRRRNIFAKPNSEPGLCILRFDRDGGENLSRWNWPLWGEDR